MTSREDLKLRLKAQRQSQLGTTSSRLVEDNGMAMPASDTEDAVEAFSQQSEAMLEHENEQIVSERLAAALANKRKKNQQQVQDRQMADDEDITRAMQKAKMRMKQKVDEVEANSDIATAADNAIPNVTVTATSEDDIAAAAAASAPATARSATTPRSSVTPRKAGESLNVTLRQKYMEKMKAAKDQGKDLEYTERKSENKLVGKRAELRSTRFDDDLQDKEDKELEEKLESSLRAKSRWRTLITKTTVEETQAEVLPTPEESYNFFMQVWESDDEDDKKGKKPGESPAPADVEPTEATAEPGSAAEQTPPVTEEAAEEETRRKKRKRGGAEDEEMLLGEVDDDYSWMPYQVARADYTPYQEKLAREEKDFFYPSGLAVPVEKKIPPDAQPRYLEDEGFYVGPKPYVSRTNINRMENRLLREAYEQQASNNDEEAAIGNKIPGALKWFGEDGRLIAQPDPTKEISSRPTITEVEELGLTTQYLSPEMIDESATLGGDRYQLDVDVNTLVFDHHHLFSREHVKAAELTGLYNEYAVRSKKNAVDFLTAKMKALRAASLHIEETIASLQEDPSMASHTGVLRTQEARLEEYRNELRLTRKQRDREMETDRTLYKKIINAWKEIRNLRATQQCTNTSVKLTIRKELTDERCDQEEWDQDVEDEMRELQDEVMDDYRRQVEEYNVQQKLWQEQKQRKKEAKKRQASRRKQPTGRLIIDGVEESAEDVGRDEAAINEPDLQKPVKPKAVTVTDTRQQIIARYNEIRRLPGEPKLFFELSNTSVITDTQNCPRSEQQRRNDVSKIRMFIRVLFNEKEVSKTESRPLGQDFTIRFARIFNLEIICWPECITMEIYETYGLTTNLISTVYAAVPESTVTSKTCDLVDIEFSSELKQSYSHDGVGSGVPFTMQTPNDTILLTSGKLMASVCWAVDEQDKALAPPVVGSQNRFYGGLRVRDPIADIGLSGLCDMDKLMKWIEESKLDPNDPSNADIVHLIHPGGIDGDAVVSSYRRPDYFRLEHVQEEFDFCTDEDIANSRRFKFITLRDQDVPFFKNQKVPLFDHEISDELFKDYEKKVREEERLREADDTDSHHIAVAKFMQKTRENVAQRYRLAAHSKTYDDMIKEDVVPNVSAMLALLQSEEESIVLPKLLTLVEPQRPLRPKRAERKKITAQNLPSVDVKIIANIIRAYGIPIRDTAGSTAPAMPPSPRRQAQGMGDLSADNAQQQNMAQVRPFVEAMFQQKVFATSVSEGPNPSWHEELCVPFRPPHNDYSSAALQTINDALYLNIFDEFVTDISQNDHDRGSTVHRRVERRWLGGIKLPFTTIYSNGRVEGTFLVERPPILLGYKADSRVVNTDGATDSAFRNSENTYITLFVTIEPPLAAPEPSQEKFESMESDQLMAASDKYLTELFKKFPDRNYVTTVVSLEGIAIFVSRYIKPLKPPDSVLDGGAESIARYVSLIPFLSDNVVYPGLCDIWSDCSQFLQMLQGDEEEHAVLLTNYFLHIGKKAWLVLGSAIPEGDTAYVLTQENDGQYFLWNAAKGEQFSAMDSYCPLQSVACVINAENVWANVQPQEKPCQMTFDLANGSKWRPFFDKKFPSPGLGSIQPDELNYFETNPAETKRLQVKIETELKKKIGEWRPKFVTRWNRLCMQSFQQLLHQMEETRGKGQHAEHVAALERDLGSYKMCGFPINMPYTDMKAICDAVYATGVHAYESSEVEFALAVHIHPYPNSVLSVWVYVASLVRKRS